MHQRHISQAKHGGHRLKARNIVCKRGVMRRIIRRAGLRESYKLRAYQ